jgi:uncharacterized protein (TIGR00266 family)
MNEMKNFDNVQYEIKGYDTQFVEVTLKSNQSIISQPGAMMYMEQGIQMSSRLSDGSAQHTGLMGSVTGMGKRFMAGEDLFVTFYTNNDNVPHKVAFAGNFLGKVYAVNLSEYGGEILCQRGSFLCSSKGTSISVGFNKKLGAGLFGGEGFIMQKLLGNGVAFICSSGAIEEKKLVKDEVLYVESGSLLAFQKGVDFSIEALKGIKNIIFSGEKLFLAKLTGPGKVLIQSMPSGRFINFLTSEVFSLIKDSKK